MWLKTIQLIKNTHIPYTGGTLNDKILQMVESTMWVADDEPRPEGFS